MPEGVGPLHNTKRGVALHGDKVDMTGQDAVLIALDAATGRSRERAGRRLAGRLLLNLAPLIVNGKVMAGMSGGEFGARGFVAHSRWRATAWGALLAAQLAVEIDAAGAHEMLDDQAAVGDHCAIVVDDVYGSLPLGLGRGCGSESPHPAA